MSISVFWFRRDLRLEDNPALLAALEEGSEIVPFYVFDPRHYAAGPYGFPKTGAHRAQFIRESVSDLRRALRTKGSELWIHQGSAAQGIAALQEHYAISAVYCAEEVSWEEKAEEEEIAKLGLPLKRFWQYSLYSREDLPMALGEIPGVFTAFRKKMEKYSQVREPLPAPEKISSPPIQGAGEIPSLADPGHEQAPTDKRAVLPFKGGSEAALQRLNRYFWEEDRLRDYKNTRNGLIGQAYSSKFSPWLAQGCISPRQIYAEIKAYEEERVQNSSTYWLYFELIWRDFFRFTAAKEGSSFFKFRRDQWPAVHPDFDQWRMGNTGQDFVDANMRELLYSGFMSNRGRQNVASFLVRDLGQPWQAGAAWFESQLLDYDVCSNWGNWTYVAGVGADPRDNRYFNVAGQAERYDRKGKYRQLWLNET